MKTGVSVCLEEEGTQAYGLLKFIIMARVCSKRLVILMPAWLSR